jgi:hypothetical protein
VNDRPTMPTKVLDLCAYRAARRPREAAEVAGLALYAQLLAEARTGVAAVLALETTTREEVSVALHRAAGADALPQG